MEPRIAVAVFPPPAAIAVVEEFRRLHDPLFHRIAAHVAVLPALAWRGEAEALPRLAEAVRGCGRGPFPVNLCGAGRTKDGTVFVKVDEGAAALGALHALLLASLGPPAGHEPPPYVPVLSLGRGNTVSESEFLQRQVAGHVAPVRFPVEHLSFLVEDARGIWVERERLALPLPA